MILKASEYIRALIRAANIADNYAERHGHLRWTPVEVAIAQEELARLWPPRGVLLTQQIARN